MPASIWGFKTKKDNRIKKSGGAEAIAHEFFVKNKRLFRYRENIDDMAGVKENIHMGSHHVLLAQKYKGIPVYSADYTVTLDGEGRIDMICGQFYPDINISTKPSITQSGAIQIALASKSNPALRYAPQSELVVFPLGDSYKLAYRVHLPTEESYANWYVVVDALDGSIIRSDDLTMRYDGSGYVYEIDPYNSPNLSTVTLPRLLGNGTLTGSNVKVWNYNYQISDNGRTQTVRTNNQFYFTPPDYTQIDYTAFDEVNVYYHADKFIEWSKNSNGFAGMPILNVGIHYGDDLRAQYRSDLNMIWLGGGDRMNAYDYAKKNDVIYHEAQHAISHSIGLKYDPGESVALHEGYSDYFAASYSVDPILGDWVQICTDNGHVRRVDNDRSVFKYGPGMEDLLYGYCSLADEPINQGSYTLGMIWSGALWDLRNQLGASVTDRLAMKAIYLRNGTATLMQARDAFIQADSGMHTAVIQQIFDLRGLTPFMTLQISGPDCSCPGDVVTYSPDAIGGRAPYTYQWSMAEPCLWPQLVNDDPGCDTYVLTSITRDLVLTSPQYKSLRLRITDADGRVTYAYKTINAPLGIYPDDPNYSRCGCNTLDSIPLTKIARLTTPAIPDKFELQQNYPNPFNPGTMIRFSIKEPCKVSLTIYNIQGHKVKTLLSNYMNASEYTVEWDGNDDKGRSVASGLYFYRIEAGAFSRTKKMLLLR